MRKEDQTVEEQIAALLGSLKRVEPPGDFDFKVRARIAQGRPSAFAVSWLPASVRLAIPMGLVLAVGGYFGYNALNQGSSTQAPTAADAAPVNPSVTSFLPVESVPAAGPETAEVTQAEPDAPERDTERRQVAAPVRRTARTAPSTESRGGSLDSALRETKTLFPVNANTNANAADPVSPAASRITGKTALDRIGVRATFTGSGWKVDSVSADSAAGRAGVKVGDVIESVNGRALSDKQTVEEDFSPKGVRLRRDGRTVMVGLKP